MITGKFKIKLKISNEAGKKKAIQAYLFYLLFLFPFKKINSRKAESRKENDDKK